MTQCYWKLCQCPDNQPCTEHTGFFCSTFDGATVGSLRQVNDNNTRDAEMALVRLSDHAAEIERLRGEIEAKKANLERMKQTLEAMVASAASLAERRAVVNQATRARDLILRLDPQIKQAAADLQSLGGQIMSVGGSINSYLIVPYTSATGYCECYSEKLRQLAPIAAKTHAIKVNELDPAVAQRAAASTQYFGMASSGALSTYGGVIAGLAFFTTAAVYLAFGILELALFTLLIGLIVFVLMLLALIIVLLDANARIVAARRKIVRLDLHYYRMQNITTCQRAALPEPSTGSGVSLPPEVVDENAWWRELIGPPPQPAD